MLKNNLPPIHPGAYIRDSLPEAGFSQAELAEILGCSRSYVSDIVNGRKGLSVDMCFKLPAVLGGSPGFWSRLQNGYDMKVAEGDRGIAAAVRHVRARAKAAMNERHA
jgi:antitoxin HigA-1